MADWNFVNELTATLCRIGRNTRTIPGLSQVEPFRHYFSDNSKLKYKELDEYDGGFTRREILTRYLLLNAVLDQGPDMKGVCLFLRDVISYLYRKEIRIFHRPLDFFKELGISIDEIVNRHESIKKIRSKDWARENDSTASRYNLFFAQSQRGMIATKQVLDYAIHRWGVPLCVPLLLEKDLKRDNKESPQPLIDYLESYPSAEIMAKELKDNDRYGLGSAIGDKACHLFAKLYVSILKLVKQSSDNKGWTDISYEVPFDSNAGRVLFRTGFFLEFVSPKEFENNDVIQRGKAEGGRHYIRVTNMRGIRTSVIDSGSEYFKNYVDLVTNYLKISTRPRSVEIQRLPSIIIYGFLKKNIHYSIADFDDGLMYVGTKYCFNTGNPKCSECPLKNMCKGNKKNHKLIDDYRT